MHKMMRLISNFLYKKIMFPFIQLYVHYVNFMKKNHMKISKFWKFEAKGYKGNDSFIK
jgi:hypothetical protein